MGVAQRIAGREKDLGGGFTIRRVLPHARCRHVGPWVFLDLFGPQEVEAGALAVRPHPHIGLATVTFLYAGSMVHRDSLGSHQVITPGAVNLMTAGRGIVHSERSEAYAGPMHGLQLWLALPDGLQDMEPAFDHVPADALPAWKEGGSELRLGLGTLGGRTSPVPTRSPTVFVDVRLAGTVEIAREHDELAVLAVDGDVRVGGEPLPVGTLAVVDGALRLEGSGRAAVLGGSAVGARHMEWNFVHGDPARIRQAVEDWAADRFPRVPGEHERIPYAGRP
ncbi:MAG: pirin family protein [Alphaproteobacteria bacterium]|nr:pirin family protein [Alphaproteobacteria bacterium]